LYAVLSCKKKVGDYFLPGIWVLPGPSDGKIWSGVLWDSEPKFAVLTRVDINSVVRQFVLKLLVIEEDKWK
jgi:hypothetical protein